jgi:hypothetical protein
VQQKTCDKHNANKGIVGECNFDNEAIQKVLHIVLWWSSVFRDAKEYCKCCNICQRIGKPFQQDEPPLFLITMIESFDRRDIEFTGPIISPVPHTGARYIITTTNYLTHWLEVATVKYCIVEKTTCFIFEVIITIFGYTKVLMNN